MSGPHSVDPSADDRALPADPAARDPFAHDDGVYVLGALARSERTTFEQHLLSCQQCRVRVSEIQHLPRLLSGLSVADLIVADLIGDGVIGDGVIGDGVIGDGVIGGAGDEPMPDTLLPGLLRRAAVQRRHRRLVVSSLAGFAAACLVALAVVLWPSGAATTRPTPRALVPVLVSPVQAEAALVARPWGTEIDLHCRYAKGFDDPLPYLLTISDRHGREERLGTWRLAAGEEISFSAGTALRPAQISQVVIAQLDGTAILRLAN